MGHKSFLESLKLEPPSPEPDLEPGPSGPLPKIKKTRPNAEINLEDVLKSVGIDVPIETIFAMSKVEFIRFRNSGNFTPTQLKTLTVVRKRCKLERKMILSEKL